MPPLWGPKKRCRADRSNVAPDPLADPGNPSYHPQARAPPHPARSHHRMVALATRSPSRSKASAPQAKIATVVLSSHDPLHSGPVNARQMEPSSLGSSAQCHVAYINGSVKSQHRIGALCYADETSLGYADETSLAPDLIFSARCGSVQFGRMK